MVSGKWGGKKYLIEPKEGYVYVRKGGKYIGRITADLGTAEFDQQYWDILRGGAVEAKTSFNALIASYKSSYRWTKLKSRTRKTYELVLIYLEEKNGKRDATKTRRKDIIAAMDKNTHRMKFANDIPAVMSVLFEHAIDLGWMDSNPARGVKKRPIPVERRRPHIIPDDEICQKWRAEADLRPLVIFELGLGSVQRLGDWPSFNWGDYDGKNLHLRGQSKTGKALFLPCTPQLNAVLERWKASLGFVPHPSKAILTGERGGRISTSYCAQVMSKERIRLGMKGAFDQHGLRYRGVMELAWAGCSDDEIMSYSGHENKAMVVKYAGLARQIMRATTAAEKRRLWALA